MKYLIMCEGTNEKKIIDILLAYGRLNIQQDDLLGLATYHARQIKKSTVVQANLRIYGGEVEVYRIGDKMSDKLDIPQEFKRQIKKEVKFCTLPELEVLLIISENKYKEYEKIKSIKKPKQFAKEQIVFQGKKYNNATEFYDNYYGQEPEKLVAAIRKYKQLHGSHKNDEHYLLELLKE